MVNREIQSDIESIEKNGAPYVETNFAGRAQARDHLEFNIIDRIEGLLETVDPPEGLVPLKEFAKKVMRELEGIDANLFQRLRSDIRMGGGRGTAFTGLIDKYVGRGSGASRHQEEIGYDSLDVFINGLLLIQALPLETRISEPEMVHYQQTPARIILELAEKAHLTGDDVFYDLGSGLGHVPIVVHLLSGATVKGIEFEPAYCDLAMACAADLGLSRVEFINADARTADYSDGTVFFMYTPFEGSMLQGVLDRVRGASRKRRIRLFTYGPCTPQVSRQSWLERVGQNRDQVHRLGEFRVR